ncbi:MAG: hypothetical protein AN484_19810 [Aphanizomenon flos-aquae WA102]|uniref:Uncharacterized protein n=1 Tax=Aphanizomenon flos-aquae WA102 TaxID=1710896 RepID=A0A1B7WY04_APHFL|nr:MAG: hypothetical protein AN484_19810 [Aphanizomenon flos-aquae WA102]
MTNQYKLQNNPMTNQPCSVGIIGKAIAIPFAVGNTDYDEFKKEVLAGAELQNAEGNVMTHEQADAYIATLP